jgi:two-component system, chemotaxis family, chemotaxis protein CheY
MSTNPASQDNKTPDTQRTILIVEDDISTRKLYHFVLMQSGYNVLEATDGIEALNYLATHTCHLVITDMNMPRMSGLELIQAIRSSNTSLPVILLTAFDGPNMRQTALNLGASAFFAKPFTIEDLEQSIRQFLEC